jgi:hypothetical protein
MNDGRTPLKQAVEFLPLPMRWLPTGVIHYVYEGGRCKVLREESHPMIGIRYVECK